MPAVAAVARGKWATLIAMLLLGAVLGATGATLRLGREIDRVHLDNAILIDEVERLAGELASRERAAYGEPKTPGSNSGNRDRNSIGGAHPRPRRAARP